MCSDANIITNKNYLNPAGKKVVLIFFYDYYFTIPYIIDVIPNSPANTGYEELLYHNY